MKCLRCHGTGREPDLRRMGAELRAARTRRELTLREMARRAKVSPSYLSDLELGRRAFQGAGARRVLKAAGMGVELT